MEMISIALVSLLCLFLFLGGGVWVGLALIGVASMLLTVFIDTSAGDALFLVTWSSATSWPLTALPLFIWMGEILYRTRLSQDLFKALAPWLAPLPGGLLHTNIVGCTLFAAVSGSSAATLTTIGKISIPELRKRGYPEGQIIGTLAGASTLGLMIPPSLTLIVYGVTVNESIAKLFLAGVIPGIVLAGLFMGYIAYKALVNKEAHTNEGTKVSLVEKVKLLKLLAPVVLLIVFIIGSIYSGFATPTEAAALGAAGSLIFSFLQGSLTKANFADSLLGAAKTSSMIALILIGASYLALAMGFTGLPTGIATWIGGFKLDTLELILILTIFYIIIGMFLDGISAIVLTMAVVEPMITAAGIDLIWFGIFIVVLVEMAQITPPVGFNLFVLQGITNHKMGFISKAAIPMFMIMGFMIILLILFPSLATWLPNI